MDILRTPDDCFAALADFPWTPTYRLITDGEGHSQKVETFSVSRIVNSGVQRELGPEELAAYDAPFPEERYKSAARQFPALVPVTPDDPEADANRRAWEALRAFDKPWLTAFSDQDPVTRGGEKPFQKLIPGARDQGHVTMAGGGHFLQEDMGPELARTVLEFMGIAVKH